jgi:hypothetical protein
MRTSIVATGVVIGLMVGQIAAAQGSGAAPAPGVSFTPAPRTTGPSRHSAPSPRSAPGAGVQPRPGGPSSPSFAPPIRPDLRRPTLGNMPAPPLDTTGPRDLYRANRRTYERITPPWLSPGWIAGGGYAESYESFDDAARPTSAGRPGYLVLRVEPAGAEVYVDGFYIGTVRDLAGGRALPEGPYRLELRAEGFDTTTTDLRVLAGETITLSRSLARTPAPAPPAVAQAAPPAPARPFYVIRGCYAGSTHPKDVRLPAGCDVKNARVVGPVVNEVTRPRS